MGAVWISIAVFSLLFGGALLGMYFDPFPQADQLKDETRTHVQLAVGLLTSMFALLLSLQLSSGKTSFDAQEQDVTIMAARAAMLDRVLAHYGPEAQDARESLRRVVIDILNEVWPMERSKESTWTPLIGGEEFYDKIQQLSPKNEEQISEKATAIDMAIDLGQMRWKSVERVRSSTAVPLMTVEIAWATIVFISFGLLAPRNATVIVSLAVCAAAVAGGFFLIVELNTPFNGLLHVSSAPIREALKYLAR
jgi:Protein of unknown function (DUF4239)